MMLALSEHQFDFSQMAEPWEAYRVTQVLRGELFFFVDGIMNGTLSNQFSNAPQQPSDGGEGGEQTPSLTEVVNRILNFFQVFQLFYVEYLRKFRTLVEQVFFGPVRFN